MKLNLTTYTLIHGADNWWIEPYQCCEPVCHCESSNYDINCGLSLVEARAAMIRDMQAWNDPRAKELVTMTYAGFVKRYRK